MQCYDLGFKSFVTMEEAKNLFQDDTVAEQKPVICDDCGAIFLYQDELFDHKIEHNSNPPEQCDSSVRKGNSAYLSNFDNEFTYNNIKIAIKDEIIKEESTDDIELHETIKEEEESTDNIELYETIKEEEEATNNIERHGNLLEQSLGGSTSVDAPLELIVNNHYDFGHVTDFETNLEILHSKTYISENENTQMCCQDCGKMCANEISLIRHEKAHKSNFTFVCEICGVFYKYKKSYESHLLTHKEFRNPIASPKRQEFQTSSFNYHEIAYKNGFPLVCEICGIVYKYRKSFMAHVAMHKNRVPVIEPALTHETQQTEETETSEVARENCQASFNSDKSETLTHFVARDIRPSGYPYECKICGVTFRYKYLLRKHCCLTRLVCKTCGEFCKTKLVLKRHKKIHPIEKKFCCKECNEVFAANTQLQEHQLLVHSKNKPVLICEGCERRFPSKNLLNVHQSKYYGKASDSYLCKHCSEPFICRTARQRHEILHDT